MQETIVGVLEATVLNGLSRLDELDKREAWKCITRGSQIWPSLHCVVSLGQPRALFSFLGPWFSMFCFGPWFPTSFFIFSPPVFFVWNSPYHLLHSLGTPQPHLQKLILRGWVGALAPLRVCIYTFKLISI